MAIVSTSVVFLGDTKRRVKNSHTNEGKKSVGNETRRYLKKEDRLTYPLACFRSSSPSSVKSFCKSSTSMPSSPSARSRAIAAEILVLFVARARRGRCFRDTDDFIVEPSGRPLLREHNAKSSLNPNPNPTGPPGILTRE